MKGLIYYLRAVYYTFFDIDLHEDGKMFKFGEGGHSTQIK
jgi:hypothetical protein